MTKSSYRLTLYDRNGQPANVQLLPVGQSVEWRPGWPSSVSRVLLEYLPPAEDEDEDGRYDSAYGDGT